MVTPVRTLFHRRNLSSDLQKAYDLTGDAIWQYKPVVQVPGAIQHLEAKEWNKVFSAFCYDHPDFIQADQLRVSTWAGGAEVGITHAIPRDVMLRLRRECQYRADEIVRKHRLDKGTPCEKAWKIYRYLATHVTYGKSAYPMLEYAAAGALLYGKAVCQGIAQAYRLLGEIVGLNVLIAYGKQHTDDENGHAWNVVDLGGGVLGHVDVVAAIGLKKSDLSRAYFMLSTATLSEEYQIECAPPCCGLQKNPVFAYGSRGLDTALQNARPGDYLRIKLPPGLEEKTFLRSMHKAVSTNYDCYALADKLYLIHFS